MIFRTVTILFLGGIVALSVVEYIAMAAGAKPKPDEPKLARADSRAGQQSSLRDRELRNLEQVVQSLGGKPRHAVILQCAGREFDIDPLLLASLAHVESHFNPMATSKKGARGLMQLRPVVTQVLGVVDPWDPYENIMAGAAYLRTCFDRYADHTNSTYLALAAYNIGPGPVEKITTSDAGERFVKKVLLVYNTLTDVPICLAERGLKKPVGPNLPAFAEFLDIR